MAHTSHFDEIDQAAEQSVLAALNLLADRLQQDGEYHELFEAIKMQLRHQLGLPLLYNDGGDELSAEVRDKLEDGLLAACRKVGTLFFEALQIRDGYNYLRPVGDRKLCEQLLAAVPENEQTVDQLIEIGFHEGMDVARGFRLLLAHYGTCNAITTFESAMYGQARETRSPAVQLLVSHVYDELRTSVVSHLQRLNITCDASASLRQLVADHPQLFADGAYHIDTTHLASTVRAAKDLSDSQRIELADELAEYGRRLAPELQYPGDPPFAEFYPAHQKYFAILLNPDATAVADELDYFRQQAVDSNPMEETTAAIEVYIDLLHRIGRSQAAIDARRELLPDDIQTTGQAPGLLELCQAADNFDALKQLCLHRQDLLGYTMAVLKATSERT